MLVRYSDTDPFEDLFRGFNLLSTPKTSPPANIIECQGGYEIRMLTPGYSKSDMRISITDSLLKISAEKKHSEDRVLHREYSDSKFERSFSLPESVSREGISATCENGVLLVRVPLKNKEHERSLEIAVQ